MLLSEIRLWHVYCTEFCTKNVVLTLSLKKNTGVIGIMLHDILKLFFINNNKIIIMFVLGSLLMSKMTSGYLIILVGVLDE